jgi:hypothetical protein
MNPDRSSVGDLFEQKSSLASIVGNFTEISNQFEHLRIGLIDTELAHLFPLSSMNSNKDGLSSGVVDNSAS